MNIATITGGRRFRSLVLSPLLLALALAGCGGGGGGGGGDGPVPTPMQSAAVSASSAVEGSGTAAAAPAEADPTPTDPTPSDPIPTDPTPSGPTAPEPAPPVLRNFSAAHLVIGQPDFKSDRPNQDGPATLVTLNRPMGASALGPQGQLVVSDYENNRVLIFPALPTGNGAAASFQLPASGPVHVTVHGERLLVVEYKAHRVSIYKRFPVDASALPDVTVGQTGPGGTKPGIDGASLFHPYAASVTPQGRLLVADAANNRVLIWRALPEQHGQAADLVLGQSSMFRNVWKNDDNQDTRPEAYPTARTMNYPTGVWSDGRRVVVSDTYNNRLLVWTTMPESSFMPADLVLGKGGFEPGAGTDSDGDGAPDTGLSDSNIGLPYGSVASDGTRLAVADTFNHRVLVWNTFPVRNGQPADLVLGQPDFTTAQRNADNSSGFANAWGLNTPTGVQLLPGDKVLVSDTFNNRMMLFGPR